MFLVLSKREILPRQEKFAIFMIDIRRGTLEKPMIEVMFDLIVNFFLERFSIFLKKKRSFGIETEHFSQSITTWLLCNFQTNSPFVKIYSKALVNNEVTLETLADCLVALLVTPAFVLCDSLFQTSKLMKVFFTLLWSGKCQKSSKVLVTILFAVVFLLVNTIFCFNLVARPEKRSHFDPWGICSTYGRTKEAR